VYVYVCPALPVCLLSPTLSLSLNPLSVSVCSCVSLCPLFWKRYSICFLLSVQEPTVPGLSYTLGIKAEACDYNCCKSCVYIQVQLGL
jgi:hypothetical protein